MKLIDIVIVNWSSGVQLLDAMRSLKRFGTDFIASVAIVDNASTDNSLDLVVAEGEWGFPVHVIRNETNRGFGAACNQGVVRGCAEYVLFLNPDARLFEDSLASPLAFMERTDNSNVFVTGVRLIDEQGHTSRACARFPTVGMFAAAIPCTCKFGITPRHATSIT
jgi:GT2 family glycosyltransferase